MGIKTELNLSRLAFISGAALLACFIVTGCATGRAASYPAGSELATDAGRAERLDDGRVAYISACAECHRRYAPRDRTPDEWRKILARHRGRVSMTAQRFENLEYYLTEASGYLREGAVER